MIYLRQGDFDNLTEKFKNDGFVCLYCKLWYRRDNSDNIPCRCKECLRITYNRFQIGDMLRAKQLKIVANTGIMIRW